MGRFEEALSRFDWAIEKNPTFAEAYINRSHVLTKLNRIEEALTSIERAIELKPGQAEALNERGNILQALGRAEAAIASYECAIGLMPGYAQAFNNHGNALQMAGRHEQAIVSYDRAIALMPGYAVAYANRGKAMMVLAARAEDPVEAGRRREEALGNCQQAVALAPHDAAMQLTRGDALRSLGRSEEALAAYDRAESLRPDHAEVLYAGGLILLQLGRPDEARARLCRACALRPDWAEAANALGNAQHELGEWTQAIKSYDQAIALDPRFAVALANRGLALWRAGRPNEALDTVQQARAIDPELGEAHYNEALIRLTLDDFELGWRKYEWRLFRGQDLAHSAAFVQAARTGTLAGRSVLLQAEQGYGDTLQFCRYAIPVAKAGAAVTLEVPRPLVRLMKSLDGVTHVVGRGERAAAGYDLQCKLMSLPLAFGTTVGTIPADIPYFRAEPNSIEQWRQRLAGLPGLHVGIAWSGNRRGDPAAHAIDRRRSVTLDHFAPLAHVPGITLISLQKGETAQQTRTPPPGMIIHDWSGDLDDFANTAALIEGLDLVISVDTSVPHLAGALAKPVWLLSRFDACWRWLRDRTDSPWYPTMRIFRQPRPGDWASVMQDVATALRRRVACS